MQSILNCNGVVTSNIAEAAPSADEIYQRRFATNRQKVIRLISELPYLDWILIYFKPQPQFGWGIPSHISIHDTDIDAYITIEAEFSHEQITPASSPFMSVKLKFFIHQTTPTPPTESEIQDFFSKLLKHDVQIKDWQILPQLTPSTNTSSYGELIDPKLEKTVLDLMNLLKLNPLLRSEFIGTKGSQNGRLIRKNPNTTSALTEMAAPSWAEIEKTRMKTLLHQINSGRYRLPPYMENIQLYYDPRNYSSSHTTGEIAGHKFAIAYEMYLGRNFIVTINWLDSHPTGEPSTLLTYATTIINQFFQTNITADDLYELPRFVPKGRGGSFEYRSDKLLNILSPQFEILRRITNMEIIDDDELQRMVWKNASETARKQNWPFTQEVITEAAPTAAYRMRAKCTRIQQGTIKKPHALKYLRPLLDTNKDARYFDLGHDSTSPVRSLAVWLWRDNRMNYLSIWPHDLEISVVKPALRDRLNEMLQETHSIEDYDFKKDITLTHYWNSEFFFQRLKQQLAPIEDIFWNDEFFPCLLPTEKLEEAKLPIRDIITSRAQQRLSWLAKHPEHCPKWFNNIQRQPFSRGFSLRFEVRHLVIDIDIYRLANGNSVAHITPSKNDPDSPSIPYEWEIMRLIQQKMKLPFDLNDDVIHRTPTMESDYYESKKLGQYVVDTVGMHVIAAVNHDYDLAMEFLTALKNLPRQTHKQ